MYTVHLHGSLRRQAGVAESYTIEAKNAWEAIEGITRQLEQFAVSLLNPMKTVACVDHESIEELKTTKEGDQEIHLLPKLSFAGKGTTKVIIGALLIVVGFIVSPFFPPLSTALISMGFTMIADGLSPQPKMNNPDEEEKTKNRYLGTPANTVGMGVRIPRGYGTVRAGGHFLSFNTDAVEVL